MIIVWAPYDSTTAQRLTDTLAGMTQCVRVKSLKEVVCINENDLVVNWGSKSCPRAKHVLNQQVVGNKLTELARLHAAKIPAPALSTSSREGYLARFIDHVDGYDLLESPAKGDYYVEFVETEDEYRVHSFKGRSLLLEKRVPNGEKEAHPWVRSCKAGWTLKAGVFDHRAPFLEPIRSIAHAAVKALGYDFGAVDIARRKGGGLVVFEVNSGPGLEGYEVDVYVNALLKEEKKR